MDKLDIFHSRFGKIVEFGQWDLETISADACTKFTSTEFKDECHTRSVYLTLEDPESLETNEQVEVKRRTLRTIAHSLMVNARVLEMCIQFALMYTEDHILLVLPIKDLINKDSKTTTPLKVVTGLKPSVSNSWVLFFHVLYKKKHIFGYKH